MASMQSWFFQFTLPMVIAIFTAAWMQTRGIGLEVKRVHDPRADFNNLRGEFRGLRADFNNLRAEFVAFRAEVTTELRLQRTAITELDHRVTRLEERLAPIARG